MLPFVYTHRPARLLDAHLESVRAECPHEHAGRRAAAVVDGGAGPIKNYSLQPAPVGRTFHSDLHLSGLVRHGVNYIIHADANAEVGKFGWIFGIVGVLPGVA